MKKLKQYGNNIIANIGENNSDFSTKNKIPNSRVTCFTIVSIVTLMIINIKVILNVHSFCQFWFTVV